MYAAWITGHWLKCLQHGLQFIGCSVCSMDYISETGVPVWHIEWFNVVHVEVILILGSVLKVKLQYTGQQND